MDARRYLLILAGLSGGVIAAIVGLNLLLEGRAEGGPEVARAASAWQQATRGVTYAPPYTDSRYFKRLRLGDRLPDINAIVLGDSMLMAVTESAFPPHLRPYNFAFVAHSTAGVVAEFEYVERHWSDRVRFALIGLDWPIGMIYAPEVAGTADLSPGADGTVARVPAPLHARMADALSRPKVASLAAALAYIVRAPDAAAAFRHTFFAVAGDPYRCPDGASARDFDVLRRGLCAGFRYDGSWTFAGERRLDAARAATLARAAAAPSSKFSRALEATQGVPEAENLRRLGEAARRYAARGAEAVFILPPLVPGMERELLQQPQARERLLRTKRILGEWARQYGAAVIDAGQSERYGCEPGEFLDENHAYPSCHARVLERYRRDREAGRAAPGLYQPPLPGG